MYTYVLVLASSKPSQQAPDRILHVNNRRHIPTELLCFQPHRVILFVISFMQFFINNLTLFLAVCGYLQHDIIWYICLLNFVYDKFTSAERSYEVMSL